MDTDESIRVTCPKCGHRLRVKASAAGKRARCPNVTCGAVITIPSESQPPPQPDRAVSRPAMRRWIWIGVGAVLVITVSAGVAVVVGGGLGRSKPESGGQTPDRPPDQIAAKTTPKDGPGEPARPPESASPRVGDWFSWRATFNGKANPPMKTTITGVDETNVSFETERMDNGKTVKDPFKYVLADLRKSPFELRKGEKELLGKGTETLQVGERAIECEWVHFKWVEKGDPQKFTINGVPYGETHINVEKVWYSPRIPFPDGVKKESKRSEYIPPEVQRRFAFLRPDPDVVMVVELIDFGSSWDSPRK